MILSACGIAADSPSGLLGINLGCLAGWMNGRRPADILPTAGRMGSVRERREVGDAVYNRLFEDQAVPCAEIALTAGTANFSTIPWLLSDG